MLGLSSRLGRFAEPPQVICNTREGSSVPSYYNPPNSPKQEYGSHRITPPSKSALRGPASARAEKRRSVAPRLRKSYKPPNHRKHKESDERASQHEDYEWPIDSHSSTERIAARAKSRLLMLP